MEIIYPPEVAPVSAALLQNQEVGIKDNNRKFEGRSNVHGRNITSNAPLPERDVRANINERGGRSSQDVRTATNAEYGYSQDFRAITRPLPTDQGYESNIVHGTGHPSLNEVTGEKNYTRGRQANDTVTRNFHLSRQPPPEPSVDKAIQTIKAAFRNKKFEGEELESIDESIKQHEILCGQLGMTVDQKS